MAKTTRVYRAVSQKEYHGVMITGRFEIVPQSAEGKHFADTIEGARRFGEALMGAGGFKIVEADVPDDAVSLFRWANLDGFGPARFLHIDDLRDVQARPYAGGDQ